MQSINNRLCQMQYSFSQETLLLDGLDFCSHFKAGELRLENNGKNIMVRTQVSPICG